MRIAFIERLLTRAKQDKKIFLMVGDLGYSVIEEFADSLPDQFMNAGIAEQNMVGMAAGLASEGYNVFVYSIANFPTFRAAEQIRNDVDYHNLPVNIVAVGGGLGYGSLGYTHHAIQDMALMRLFPNFRLLTPSSDLEAGACVDYLVDNPGPSYLRLDKSSLIDLKSDDALGLKVGIWRRLSKERESIGAVLAVGSAVRAAQSLVNSRETELSLFSLPIWGYGAEGLQAHQIRAFSTLYVFEDHLVAGGLGSWLLETLSLEDPTLASRIRLRALSNDVLGRVGSQRHLEEVGGLWKSE